MASYLPQTLMALVQQGTNLHIESGYMPQTLIEIMRIAKKTGAHITISGRYLPTTLEQLASIGGNNLTILVR